MIQRAFLSWNQCTMSRRTLYRCATPCHPASCWAPLFFGPVHPTTAGPVCQSHRQVPLFHRSVSPAFFILELLPSFNHSSSRMGSLRPKAGHSPLAEAPKMRPRSSRTAAEAPFDGPDARSFGSPEVCADGWESAWMSRGISHGRGA